MNKPEPGAKRRQSETTASDAREASEEHRDWFEFAPVGCFLWDHESRIQEVNQAGAALLNSDRNEVIGQPFDQFIADDDRSAFADFCKRALTTDTQQTCNVKIAGNRQTVHVLIQGNAAESRREPEKKLCRAAVIDISRQKHTEESLRENEQLYRAIGESIDYGVWVCDPGGRNIYASDSFLKLVGITQQQCSEFGWGDVLRPDDSERTIAAWKECVRTGGTWDIEHRFRGVDGRWHPILARGVPVRDEQGRVIYWAGINLDISGLKRAEDVSRESEERLRFALETSHIGAWDLDLVDHTSFRSAEHDRIFGYPSPLPHWTYEMFLEHVLPSDRAEVDAMFRQATATQGVWNVECRIRRADGEIRWIWAAGRHQADSTGNPRRMTGIVQDISERKQIEETLQFLLRCGSARDEDFYQSLATYLAWTLHADFVCIDRLEEGLLTAQTLAVWYDGKFQDNMSYTLEDTPCGTVVKEKTCCFPKGVRHLFPKDAVLQEMKAEGYLGSVLWDTQGQAIGLIAVISRQSIADPETATSILQLVGVRASAELERQRAEETLRESEERFKAIASNTPDHILVQDRDLRYLFVVNPQLGFIEQDMLGKTDHDFMSQEDADGLAEIKRRVLETGEPVRLELPLLSAKGEQEFFDGAYVPKFNSRGKVDGLIGYFTNVTERKRREGQIAKLTQLYSVLSQVNEAIVRVRDAERLFSEVCRIVAEQGGFLLCWIGRVEDHRVVPAAFWGPASEYVKQLRVETQGKWGGGPTGTCIRENRPVVNEDFAIGPATAPWRELAARYGLRASAAIPLCRQGKPIGAITIYAGNPNAFDAEQVALLESLSADLSYAMDAIEQEQIRARVEERTRLLSEITAELLASDRPQRIIELLCCGVMAHLGCHVFFNFLVDEETGRLHLNASAGIPEADARRIEWLDYGVAVCGCVAKEGCRIVVEDIQSTANPRADLIRSFGVQAYACHPLMNQGKVVGTLSFGSRTKLTFAEDELRLMKTVADNVAIAIQRVRLLESLERHAKTAEAANEAKSRFLANMSHELRTPMNAILGLIDVALPRATDPAVQDCLNTARESADLLLTLLNDLLDSAKIESGKLELESAPFSLRQMLNQITQVLAARASEKGLNLSCHILESAPDALIGDQLRLRQILFNLAGNAIKFTDDGEIEISLVSFAPVAGEEPRIEAGEERPRPDSFPKGEGDIVLEFAVRDTGIGIPAADLDHIFQSFAQADADTARRFGGTGLGLAISKSLVEMMNGRIWVESEVGRGSIFHFTVRLPLSKEPPPPRVPPTISAAPASVLRILLAEDNPANQKLMEYVLRDRGHEIEIATNGQEAVAKLAEDDYDIVLMDVQMPIMDGYQATVAIRALADPAKARLPIVAITAHAMREYAQRCLSVGMDACITKPICAPELIEVVERLAASAPATPDVRPAIAAKEQNWPPRTATEPSTAAFDLDEARKRCFDKQMFGEMVEYFFADSVEILGKLRDALRDGNAEDVARTVHRFRGTAIYLSATPTMNAADRVEKAGDSGDLAVAAEAFRELESEVEILKQALGPHRRSKKA